MGTTNGIDDSVRALTGYPVGGLTDTPDSIAYILAEIDGHIHVEETWVGKSADQSYETWASDSLTPFQCISGDGTYGADTYDEAKVFGLDDLPRRAGKTYFDIHRILVVGTSSETEYKLRLIWGTGSMSAAISAGQYSELMIKFDPLAPAQSAGHPFNVKMPRIAATNRVWAQCKNATDDATLDFYIGTHEYEG